MSSQKKIIYEYIFDTSRLLQENASLANEFRISLVRTILQHGVNWKAPELRNRIVNWILTGAHVLNNDYQMIRSSIGQLLFNTLVWKDRNKCKLDSIIAKLDGLESPTPANRPRAHDRPLKIFLVNADHPFALDLMKVIYQKYEDLPNEDDKRHLFKTIIYSLNKIISFSIKTTWLWLPVLVSKIKWAASSRWSFSPNSAWGSIGTATIGKMHPTLLVPYWLIFEQKNVLVA